MLVIRTLLFLIGGVSLTLLARAARRTIHDAVELEISNLEIKERQTEIVLESKVSAVRALVAGVAHELNTPAGAIRSSGPGIPADELSTLFDIGFRAGKGRMSMELGPLVARQIVEHHGGSLTASSNYFTISLPM